ncbi:MAG: Asp-tRNA(Asn)/Glu-tRNA(Gln) amidotransferase subunit GatA, partial [Pseudomonadota bacterium]|nr:Asp-tRNA(Asn)/Glu-tRNA(Gln) amidotransferase subunit GatA [Pseudomonadota bacterium]
MGFHNLSLKEQLQGLKKGSFSSTELTSHYLERIEKYDDELNSFISITAERALIQAQDSDKRYANNQAYGLDGIPLAHKDIFCTKDVLTTCGSKMLHNFVSPYSSTVYEKLDAQGMVMLGKTNMDEFAMGSSNETSYFGPVKNPWNKEYVPGGSSGGSAACVAANLTPVATATDTGGSIRQPASLCGLTGIKPTYGRVSRYGMIAFASSLDQGGVLAKSAEDAALILEAMSGYDPKDSTSLDVKQIDFQTNLNESIKDLNIGLPKEFFDTELPAYLQKSIQESVDVYKNLGANIVEISLPNINLSLPIYYIIAPAECSANLSRYDGVRYGYRCKNPKDIDDLFMRTREEGFGSEVKRRILIGTYALSAGYYDAYYLKAQKCRQLVANDFAEAFKKVDVILSPT